MGLRRDTSRRLLVAMKDEPSFLDAVGEEVRSGRIRPRDARKLIRLWNEDQSRLILMFDFAINS